MLMGAPIVEMSNDEIQAVTDGDSVLCDELRAPALDVMFIAVDIGTEGATVEHAGAELLIPPGAASEPSTVTAISFEAGNGDIARSMVSVESVACSRMPSATRCGWGTSPQTWPISL